MIRFIFVVLFVVLFLILSTPLMLVEWIIGKFNPGLKDRSSLAIVNWAFRWVIRLSGTKVIAIGEENIPTDTAVLYVGNHRSFFDVVLTYDRVPRPTGYIAKKEMLKWPLLNIWMKNLHCLFLDRQDIKAGLKTIHLHLPGGHPQQDPGYLPSLPRGQFQDRRESKCSHYPHDYCEFCCGI